ncbi:hypothetical protein [Spirosoma rhododendri]|uniref:START domain-containing protein n=1 Tax=Spirosoma rhododendri TaxID=2728024 RepID=A0A7L5DMF5_9BACT|nr:hypothetical protein [Spirosoma rhododendri]QJD79305.1 hypothetical protein HH216_13455 [Spirosoma rhododendri]
MLSFYARVLVLLLMGLLPMGVMAQTSTPSRTYTYLIYHKLAPGKTLQDALPVEREWRAINQAAVDEGKLIGWHMMVKQMTSNPNPAEYDYVSAIVSPTMSIGGASPAALAKLYGDSVQVRMADLQRRDRATAPVVKMEIWSTIENLFGPAFSPGKTPIAVVNFMRPYDAREIWQPEVEVMKRVEIDRIRKDGVGGWTFSSLMVPAGSEKGYRLATVQCLSDLSALVGLTPMPLSVHQTFETVRQEVFRFMEYTVRPTGPIDKKR